MDFSNLVTSVVNALPGTIEASTKAAGNKSCFVPNSAMDAGTTITTGNGTSVVPQGHVAICDATCTIVGNSASCETSTTCKFIRKQE